MVDEGVAEGVEGVVVDVVFLDFAGGGVAVVVFEGGDEVVAARIY